MMLKIRCPACQQIMEETSTDLKTSFEAYITEMSIRQSRNKNSVNSAWMYVCDPCVEKMSAQSRELLAQSTLSKIRGQG